MIQNSSPSRKDDAGGARAGRHTRPLESQHEDEATPHHHRTTLSYDDPDFAFGQGAGQAVPLDDFDYGQNYR